MFHHKNTSTTILRDRRTMRMLAAWTRVRSISTIACKEGKLHARRRDRLSSFRIHTNANYENAINSTSTTTTTRSNHTPNSSNNSSTSMIRLSKLISQNAQNLTMSRREAERMIKSGNVTLAGETITQPQRLVEFEDVRFGALRVDGKAVQVIPNNNNNEEKGKQQQQQQNQTDEAKTRVWLVNKLSGELVADSDVHDRPCLMQRLKHGGVGRTNKGRHLHLKPIGRLDMTTEGLILVTNDGSYAREMELPSNHVHRTYRVRVHGLMTSHKSKRIQNGVTIDGIHYKGMRLEVDVSKTKRQQSVDAAARRKSSTNKWLTITCTEGKNRQIRKVFEYLGLNVTRLIRISYGDYKLNTIPAGMAIEVPVKPVEKQRRRGKLLLSNSTTNSTTTERRKPPSKKSTTTMAHDDVTDGTATSLVQWVRHV